MSFETLVSSAKKLTQEEETAISRSLMNRIKRSGPRTLTKNVDDGENGKIDETCFRHFRHGESRGNI